MAAVGSARHGAFVGRAEELEKLEDLVRGDRCAVVYLHGIAGIGKSALVAALVARLAGEGIAVRVLDCRTIEPTERGLQAALAADGAARERESGAGAAAASLLVLDHYEVFRLMDTWLRQMLVPTLPPSASVLLVGREPPVAGWFAAPGEFHSVPLGPLVNEDAVELLETLGIGAAQARSVNRIARGHPLALTLAAAGVVEQPHLELEEAATGRVIDELTQIFLHEIDDSVTKEALEAASVVRRATEPLLGAILGERDSDPGDALLRLRRLPFVETGRDGLVVHDAVREAVGAYVRATNPVRHRAYRRAAWRELREEVRDAGPAELWRYTADMLYLIENPVVREAFFPSGAQPLAVEPARAEDAAAVVGIARRHEPEEAAALLGSWWDEAPTTFSVVRDRDAVVTGFLSLLETEQIRGARAFADPVVESWARHLVEHPMPKGQVALGLRRWLDAGKGEQPCATQAACWLDVKRTYMALRPALRRMYVVVHDVPTYWPVVEKLGFRPIAASGVEIGGVEYTSVALDFGPGSVDGWLADLVGAELGVGADETADAAARELTVHGRRVSLTPLEFGLFEHLRQCEGRVVSRGDLLREVWGTEFTGGSNVVDVVVRSLRSKLNAGASAVETVRGSGYRLRSDWRARLR